MEHRSGTPIYWFWVIPACLIMAGVGWMATLAMIENPEPAPIPSSSPSPLTVQGPSLETRKLFKNSLAGSCIEQGGYPALGYGWTVICIEPGAARWVRETGLEKD